MLVDFLLTSTFAIVISTDGALIEPVEAYN